MPEAVAAFAIIDLIFHKWILNLALLQLAKYLHDIQLDIFEVSPVLLTIFLSKIENLRTNSYFKDCWQ